MREYKSSKIINGHKTSETKRMPIKLLFFAIVSMALLLVGCGNQNQKEIQKKTIAVSTIGPTHTWAESVYQNALEELEMVAAENDWDYVCVTSSDVTEQSQQVVDLVNQEVDCIVLLPMDGAALKTAAITVRQAGIPLVIFDRQIPDFAPEATVAGDNRGIGVRTAEYFNNYFPKGTTVLELMGDTSTVPFLRSDGFAETLNSNFQHIQVGYTDWQREKTKTLFKEWIRKQPAEVRRSVGAIYTHDDEIALGVLDVLDEYKEQGTIQKMFPNLKVIAGSSDSQEMYQRIREEEDYTLISLSYLPNMIRDAIQVGAHIMNGEPYEEVTIIPTELITKKNVENYIKKTTEDDINLR